MDIADAFAKAAEKAENKELLEQVKKAAKEKDREADKSQKCYYKRRGIEL